RCFGQSIALENRESETVKVTLNLFAQCGAAADEIANAPAESFVNRIEQDLAKVQRCLIAQPGVCIYQVVGSFADPVAAFVVTILDTAVQEFPKRGNADHAGDVTVLDCLRECVTRELGQVRNLRAATEWCQKACRELECVMKRQYR